MGNYPAWLESSLVETLTMMRASQFAPYVRYRERFGHSVPRSFDDFPASAERRRQLEKAYPGGIDTLEWFVGMYAEQHSKRGMLGSLMLGMVAYDAFTHALTNPLLANGIYGTKTFSEAGLREIERTSSLCDVIKRNVAGNYACSFTAMSKEPNRPLVAEPREGRRTAKA